MSEREDSPSIDLTQNENYSLQELNLIRQSLVKAESELKWIKNERETLLELQARTALRISEITEVERELDQTISKCKMALASPRNLDDDILSHIFGLLVKDYGPVFFPLRKPLPPQLTLSHVCARWRRLVLSLGCLWNDVNIKSIAEPRVRQLHQRWLARAVNEPVKMTIILKGNVDSLGEQKYLSLVQRIVVPFRIKSLHLQLSCRDLAALTNLPPSVLLDLEVLSLNLTSYKDIQSLRHLPNFAAKTRSIEFHDGDCTFPLDPQISIPWNYLLCLDTRCTYLTMQQVVEVLRQVPALRKLSLAIIHGETDPTEQLTLHDLTDLYFDIEETTPVDEILPHFQFPNVTKVEIESSTAWTPETYNTIKEKYNLQKCETIRISGGYSSTMSAVLIDAPRVRELTLPEDVIVDDSALTGVGSGTLGRSLTSLRIENAACDIDDILSMVETRWKSVQRSLEKGYTWREGFSLLKEVDLTLLRHQKVVFPERLKVLEAAGVKVLL